MYSCVLRLTGLFEGSSNGCIRKNCPFAHVRLEDVPGGDEALASLRTEVRSETDLYRTTPSVVWVSLTRRRKHDWLAD